MQGGFMMEWTGLSLALTGTVVSAGTVIYALWQLLDILADWIDERELCHSEPRH